MSRVATAARFGEGATPGTWYNPPYPEAEGDQTQRYRDTAAWLLPRIAAKAKVGVAGCGYGYTMAYLRDSAVDVWGTDLTWATTKGGSILGRIRDRIIAGDVTISADMANWKAQAGIGRNAKFSLIFTEDLLPCADSDAEVQTMLTNLRAVGTTLIHLISPRMVGTVQHPDMLWRTVPEWRALIGTADTIVMPWLEEV